MPKLPILSGREIVAILEKEGFKVVRQRGSHIVMQKHLDATTITVPIPDHREVKTGTLRSIIRQSQIQKSTFEK